MRTGRARHRSCFGLNVAAKDDPVVGGGWQLIAWPFALPCPAAGKAMGGRVIQTPLSIF